MGQGIDPNNAARNVGIVYDIGQSMAFEVGALPGMNGALAFGVSNTGYVVGASMLNQGSGLPLSGLIKVGWLPFRSPLALARDPDARLTRRAGQWETIHPPFQSRSFTMGQLPIAWPI